jgi:hypothetical protein
MNDTQAKKLGYAQGVLLVTGPDIQGRPLGANEELCNTCSSVDGRYSPIHAIPREIAANNDLHNAFCNSVLSGLQESHEQNRNSDGETLEDTIRRLKLQ